MTEAELNKRHYLKTIQPVASIYINTLSPKKELEILGDTCIIKSWYSVNKAQQKHFKDYLERNARVLGTYLNRIMQ